MPSPWTEAPPAAAPTATRLGRDVLSLMLLRCPPRPARVLGLGGFVAAAALFMLGGVLVDDLGIAAPRSANPWAVTEKSFPILLALLGAGLLCSLLGRPRLLLRAAAVALLACAPWIWAWPWLAEYAPASRAVALLPTLFAAMIGVQLARWLQADHRPRRGAAAAVLGSLILGFAFHAMPTSHWWWSEAEDEVDDEAWFAPVAALQGSAEQLWNEQPDRLQQALDQLGAQRPGVIDLYTVGVAGDGNEGVFRNEVRHLEKLVGQRFGSPGRMLSLINHPDTVADTPLASLTNLRAGLRRIGTIMDRDEDLLLLFLTSHGSEDHQFYLGLDPLPLDAIEPAALRAALDEAGIRWRVVVVSACYSGGFIEALRSDETLVITAARADRPSFGCGAQSDITWFGEAFLAEALNETTDFFQAFRDARRRIRRREEDQDERPSYPQIARGELIGARLDAWRSQLQPGPPVRFKPQPAP